MMIRSILTMQPKTGCEEAISAIFRREGVLERALTVEGCIASSMLISTGEVLVTASWTSADAYQTWIDHPERNSVSDELNELLEVPLTPETVADLYEVAIEAPVGAAS